MPDLFDYTPPVISPAGGGMGAHHCARPATTTWLTPPPVIDALGGPDAFDLDPCGLQGSPIRTARHTYALPVDGLAQPWEGRVWLNPPYTTGEIDNWLRRLVRHGRGTALIFARTETETFQAHVWRGASGLLFLEGRLHFHYPDGRRASANAGAPSVLCAYGQEDMDRLAACALPGAFVPLRLARSIVVAAIEASWRDLVLEHVRGHGAVNVSDLYRALARHPKIRDRPHWRAKVRQTLQRGPFKRLERGRWTLAAGDGTKAP